ncbi:MAG TPA: phytanoyl-CoA dioxygenase family protein [Planctomycetota bacterium]|nr:phytanoyl-CoA dioxygenase family protein [Planctomycetota bacterium]
MKYLSPGQIERFERDGYLVIDGFLDPAEVARVEAGIARVAGGASGLVRDRGGFNLEKVGDASFDTTAAAKRPGMLRKIQGAVFAVPEVREVFTGARMLDCMEDLMGPSIHYHSSKVMFKPARGGAPKPWHQDAAYWTQFASKQITVWIAIHDADEANGCVWAIPGSHRLGLIPHAEVELQVREAQIDVAKAAPVPVRRGGLLIFHSLVLHMSKRNESDRDRWCIICDYDPEANPTIDRREGDPAEGPDAQGLWTLRQPARAG